MRRARQSWSKPLSPWRWRKLLLSGLLVSFGLVYMPPTVQTRHSSPITATHSGGCRHDGDITQDGSVTPADVLRAFQHFLGLANPPLDMCEQDQANVLEPESSAITPADALCMLRRFLALPSCLDFAGARLLVVSGNNQRGAPGEVLPEPLVVRLEDQLGNPLVGAPVRFTRLLGDGTFVEPETVVLSVPSRRREETSRAPLRAQATLPEASITVVTASDGTASIRYRPGQEPLQVVEAQAPEAPNRVIFRLTLGPLAGNGTQPVNIVVGGGRGYTANSGTNNVSVFDTTGQSREVLEVIDLSRVQTAFGSGTILGVAVNTSANRLYVYGGVDDGEGTSVVLLVVDTTTNTLIEPIDVDGDGRPGLTLFITPPPRSPALIAVSPLQILGLDFGNLVTVDDVRQRIYAVIPGAVEAVIENNLTIPVHMTDGDLIVIDGRDDAMTIVARVRVGEAPTAVAVNTQTNRIYVTNRGFVKDDAANDTVTVIDGSALRVIDTVTVGRGPLGVTLDEVHDLIYVSNLFGAENLESAGAVSVINGATNTVLQSVATAGTTDLAVLVGVETPLLDDAIDRLYVNDAAGTIIDCDITRLLISDPCQIQPELSGLQGKLAINDSNTLLFGASRFDNSVAVFDLATQTVADDIRTGVSVGGLAVDTQTGTTYVSDFLGDKLFAIDPSGVFETIPLAALRQGFGAPGQVEVDATHGRIYVISPNSSGGAGGIPPVLALDRDTKELVASLEPEAWVFGSPQTLAIDEDRNLLYIATTENLVLVFDGTRFGGSTNVSDVLLAQVRVGMERGVGNPEAAQTVAVDVVRNLIYVTRFSFVELGGDPSRNALAVLRGPELDATTRALQRLPAVVADIASIGLPFGGGHRNIALDLERNLIYVAGAFGAIGAGEGFGATDIMVLDGLRIVDTQGQVTANPAAALLGVIPIRVLGDLRIPLASDFSSVEMAFDATEGLLYVVTKPVARFREGFLSVIRSDLVIDEANRTFMTTPHPINPTTLIALIATIPAGIDPEFIAVDPSRNRIVVTNQSLGGLSVLQGLSVP